MIDPGEPERRTALTLAYGQDPSVIARCYAAATLWLRGRPDTAWTTSLEAVERGRNGGHPYSLTFALAWATLVAIMRGEIDTVRAQADETIGIAEEQGFPFLLGMARMFRAWVETTSADEATAASGLASLRHALGEVARTGVSVGGGFVLGLLAEGCWNAGRTLLSHYRTTESGIAAGDTEACVTAELLDGSPVGGCGSIHTVP